MEVEVLSVNGVPEDAIISIRAGASRRQAPVSALGSTGTPFRFAGGPAGVNPFKVDVLQPIGSTRLALKPGGGTFTVPIGTDGVTVNLAVRDAIPRADVGEELFDRIDANKDGVITRREFNEAMRIEGDKPVLQPLDDRNSIPVVSSGKNRLPPWPKEEDARFPAAATAAKEYLESHRLLPFVRALLQTVVRERPEDPFNFIADQFRNAAYVPSEKPVEPPAETLAAKMAALAQASLAGALPEKLEEAAPPLDATMSELEVAKQRARQALQVALTSEAEMEQAKARPVVYDKELQSKASDAVSAAVQSGGGVDALKEKAKGAFADAFQDVDFSEESLTATAQEALMAALVDTEDANDAAAVKKQAGVALSKALLQDEDVEKVKDRARAELCAALLNPDLADAKQKARDALIMSLGEDGQEEEDIDGAKAKARNALSTVLLGGEDVESAKAKARDALVSSLLINEEVADDKANGRGDDSDEIEEAKSLARKAMAAAILGGTEDHVEDTKAQSAAPLAADLSRKMGALAQASLAGVLPEKLEKQTEELDHAQESARRALATAMVAETSEQDVAAISDELAKAEEKKAHLTLTKEELGKFQNVLKDEVQDLTGKLHNLEKERDSLRNKMSSSL